MPTGDCLCGETLTQTHHINCHHGNLRQTCHDATKKELKNLATKSGHTATEEDRGPCLRHDPHSKMRIDVLLKTIYQEEIYVLMLWLFIPINSNAIII